MKNLETHGKANALKSDDSFICLTLPAQTHWTPLVQSAAENCARVFSMPEKKSLRLAMSMEEILSHLAEVIPDDPVELRLEKKSTFLEAAFVFKAPAMNLSAMNITFSSPDPEHGLESLPLLLAARISDGFDLSRVGRQMRILLNHDFIYPPVQAADRGPEPLKGPLKAETITDAYLISHVCAHLAAGYRPDDLPEWFRFPGKAADKVAAGELTVAMAKDASGSVGSVVCWQPVSEKSVVFYGPWMLSQNSESTGAVMEHMILSLARTGTVCLFSSLSDTPVDTDLSGFGFEMMAQIRNPAGSHEQKRIWFRHMDEDEGIKVWAHPDFQPFLEEIYGRLFLPRQIRPTLATGSQVRDHSVFSAQLNPERDLAVITPLLDGFDNENNIDGHLKALCREGYKRIVFRIDLAHGWQADLGGLLMHHGCQPLIVQPLAGRADVVLFEYVCP